MVNCLRFKLSEYEIYPLPKVRSRRRIKCVYFDLTAAAEHDGTFSRSGKAPGDEKNHGSVVVKGRIRISVRNIYVFCVVVSGIEILTQFALQ
jgi:hypothetical protein